MTGVYTKMTAKVIAKTLGEVSKQQSTPSISGQDSPFKEMLNSMDTGNEMVNKLGMANNDIGLPSSDVQSMSAEGISFDTEKFKVGIEAPDGMNKVVDLLSEVNNGQMKMENMVNQILYSGKKFSNQELLAIQAHVFHFAQITELVVKAADQGVSSLKAIMNTNVQ